MSRFVSAIPGNRSSLSLADLRNPRQLRVVLAYSGYQHAVVNREAAEIALKEYRESIFKRAQESIAAEIKLAQLELESAAKAIPQARERYAKIKQVRTGSAGDLARGWQFEVGEAIARLEEKKARFALEQAQSRLTVLVEYEKRKNERKLKSGLEAARSDERAKRASWQLEQMNLTKFKQMQDPPKRRFVLTDESKQILALLDRAIPIEKRSEEAAIC